MTAGSKTWEALRCLVTCSYSLSFLVVLGLGTDEPGLEALLHHLTVIVEEQESPDSDTVAAHNFSTTEHWEDEIPVEWLKESFDGGSDKLIHIYFLNLII